MPGVTVTLDSESMQGRQQGVTTENGDYVFKLLPPGVYTISFQIQGFAPASATRRLVATESSELDITLQPAVAETVTVTGDSSTLVGTTQVSRSMQQPVLHNLPTNRDVNAAVQFGPGVHATGPGRSYSIAGGMSFLNLFLLNGVQVQDNLRGEPLPLFIEDAIQEVTTTSSGVSAEYGRFAGGLVNALTRSGGNRFSGSFRASFENDNWRSVTPFGEPKRDVTVPTYEATLGGYIVRDRLWFFGALREHEQETARQTGYSNQPFTYKKHERRLEGKLTQAFTPAQRLQFSYIGIRQDETNSAWPSSADVMDVASLVNRETPQDLGAVHYTGSFGSNLFVEAQFSARQLQFVGDGGMSRDLVLGTPLLDQTTGAYWFSPNFCGVCVDETRASTNVVLKGTYFLSTPAGAHNVVFGYDGFNDKRTADNHQSGSDYQVWATGSFIENGTVYPVMVPDGSTFVIHFPLLENSRGTNFRTHSLFVNDTWSVGRHFSVNLGVRFDRNQGNDASGTLVARDSMFSPRLGVVWDPRGDGRTTINGYYGRYVSAISNNIAGSVSAAGTPAIFAYGYEGAPINAGNGPLVTSEQALQAVFAWYTDGPKSPFYVEIPGVSRRFNGSLKSPHADEFVVGVSQQVGRRATLRIDYVARQFGDFYAERVDMTTGQATDEFGQVFDVKFIENTNELRRRYRGIDVQGDYRVGGGTMIGGSYTLSRLSGNVDGENAQSGPLTTGVLSYPEYTDRTWAFPEGDLAADQRHRARVWGTYAIPWSPLGNWSVGAVQFLESGTPYGAIGDIQSRRFVTNPGYALRPETVSYYFTPRDAFRTEAMMRTDVALNASGLLGYASGPEIFAQFQLLNVFNQFQIVNVERVDTSILTNFTDSSLARFNPFTETPVEGTHWRKGDKFGQPISRTAYTLPRTFKFSVGIKF